jgi:asparagine N-glycosylation enzyme membrane subunit Stt3
MRRSATSVLKWFSALYVVLIVIQVYLAGEGIFGLNVIKHSDDCDKKGANLIAQHCVGNSKPLDAHRALGFFLTLPGAVLFLIVALIALHPNKRVRMISILVPILTFVQMILPAAGRWGGALHPVNAFLILGMYGWLFHTLRKEAPEVATAPVTAPSG